MLIVLAFREAESRGLGVVSLGSKMIDPPVVIRAQRIIKLAQDYFTLETYHQLINSKVLNYRNLSRRKVPINEHI